MQIASNPIQQTSAAQPVKLRGFTLIELLVTISIFLILITLTAYMIRTTNESDKISAASRQIQAYIEGARAKAFQKANANKNNTSSTKPKDSIGIRLLRDKDDNSTVSSMVYLEYKAVETGTLSFLTTAYTDVATSRDRSIVGYKTGLSWNTLYDSGLLKRGSKFRFINPIGATAINNREYTITDDSKLTSNNAFHISPIYKGISDDATFDGISSFSYSVELLPTPMENVKPVELPKGTTIDLDNSVNVPTSVSTEYIDIMFSPSGAVEGAASASGVIRLVLAKKEDTDAGLDVSDIYNKDDELRGEQLIISIYTLSGTVTVSPVDMTTTATKGTAYPYQRADNVFNYAENGGEAK